MDEPARKHFAAAEMPQLPILWHDIRERAYHLWERHHRPEGFEIELWLMAERELRQERSTTTCNQPTPQTGERE